MTLRGHGDIGAWGHGDMGRRRQGSRHGKTTTTSSVDPVLNSSRTLSAPHPTLLSIRGPCLKVVTNVMSSPSVEHKRACATCQERQIHVQAIQNPTHKRAKRPCSREPPPWSIYPLVLTSSKKMQKWGNSQCSNQTLIWMNLVAFDFKLLTFERGHGLKGQPTAIS